MIVLQPPLLCEEWDGRPVCLSGDSSVLMDVRWPCDCTAQSSIHAHGIQYHSCFNTKLQRQKYHAHTDRHRDTDTDTQTDTHTHTRRNARDVTRMTRPSRVADSDTAGFPGLKAAQGHADNAI